MTMSQQVPIAITLILLVSSASAAEIIARAGAAPELRSLDGKLIPRVVRDDDGHVTRLLLSDIKLSPEDVADLGRLEHLRSLVLLRTGFTDGDLEKLTGCPIRRLCLRWRTLPRHSGNSSFS